MIVFYLSLLGLCCLSTSLILVPILKDSSANKQYFFIFSSIIIIIACILYGYFGSYFKSENWVNSGQYQYITLLHQQQATTLQQVILKMEEVVEQHPNDPKAWYLLGKLYLLKHDNAFAKTAFAKACQLAPNNKNVCLPSYDLY